MACTETSQTGVRTKFQSLGSMNSGQTCLPLETKQFSLIQDAAFEPVSRWNGNSNSNRRLRNKGSTR